MIQKENNKPNNLFLLIRLLTYYCVMVRFAPFSLDNVTQGVRDWISSQSRVLCLSPFVFFLLHLKQSGMYERKVVSYYIRQ